jgi:hypothetical protein
MARGRVLKPEVEGLIIRVHLRNQKLKAYEVRNIVEATLSTDEYYKKLWPIPSGWPSLSKVQKVVADFERKNHSDEEAPWDISTLSKYPLPPEALPTVLDIAMSSQERGEPPLTIREAKWIGRLYVLIFAVAAQQGLDKVPIAFVQGMATFHATNERISELTGKKSPPAMDEILWKFLTKRESMSELANRGFDPGHDDDRFRKGEDGRLYYRVTKKELALLKKMQRGLDPSTPFDNFASLGLTLEVKES